MIRSAYLAAEDQAEPLAEELARRGVAIDAWHGLLALSPDPAVPAVWSLNIWTDPRELAVPSIKAGADALRGLQRNWGAYAADHFRRMELITARLPPLRPKKLVFPCTAPSGHLGAWTLLTPALMLASPTQSSAFVNGEIQFQEDRTGPPSRAYLKLWEALTLLGTWPQPGETCLDLGASPGGWSYALASLGAEVTAVDKAPLDPVVAAIPSVHARQESAFGLDPARETNVDWLFSDVIAYPDRLLALVRAWIAAGAAKRIVCTLKFQGATDHAAAEAFAAIDGGSVRHLFHNKHELMFTWADASFSV